LINFGDHKGDGSNFSGGGSGAGGGGGFSESKITNAIGFDNFNITNDQAPSVSYIKYSSSDYNFKVNKFEANKIHDPEIRPRNEEFILPVIPPPLPTNLPNTKREQSPPPPFNLDVRRIC
jgi:hypothetical protein